MCRLDDPVFCRAVAAERGLERLLKEQSIIEDAAPTGVPARLKNPKKEKIPPTPLQGSDDDATYRHKQSSSAAPVGGWRFCCQPAQGSLRPGLYSVAAPRLKPDEQNDFALYY